MSIKAATSPTCDIEGFIRAINQPNVKAVIYFFSGEYERLEPHKAIKRAFPQAACIGASMIGGWSTAGASEKGIVGISLSSDEVAEAFISLQEGVKRNPVLTVEKVIRDLKQKLGHRTLYPDAYLGIVVFDGLCRGEDVIKRFTLEDDFNLDLVGGAAADELQFKKTLVSADDKCSDDGVAVVVLNMKIPFYCNHYVHYIPTDTSFTVTKAEPFKRIVWEINDQNAADYYAKIIHVSGPEKFSPSLFAKNPVGIVMGDTVYARALDIVIPGPGLRFNCSIEEGTLVHLLKRGDIIANARKSLEDAGRYLPNIQGAILFNCVLRYLELQELRKTAEFNRVFDGLNFTGFNTYGEEYFTHHNQTLTAVFFGG